MPSVHDFIEECESHAYVWLIKRLSSNDTGLTGAHQVGVYLSRQLICEVCPGWDLSTKRDVLLPCIVPSHDEPETDVRMVWYASKSEGRITNWKSHGVTDRALFDHENTGAMAVFAFHHEQGAQVSDGLRVWIARNREEEDALEALVGTVEPGQTTLLRSASLLHTSRGGRRGGCRFDLAALLQRWHGGFPSGRQVVEAAVESCTVRGTSIDDRLLKRRECEFAIFLAVEQAVVLPQVQQGFDSVDAFIQLANSITNRRKSRSGRSLELQIARILDELDISYDDQVTTEGKKRPDFLFPAGRYHDPRFPADRLRMLGVKTTCKDRWRQVINEAERIPKKHLFTLQEGVSVTQFTEMQHEGVQLVVPRKLFRKYPPAIRDQLMSFEAFVAEVEAQHIR